MKAITYTFAKLHWLMLAFVPACAILGLERKIQAVRELGTREKNQGAGTGANSRTGVGANSGAGANYSGAGHGSARPNNKE